MHDHDRLLPSELWSSSIDLLSHYVICRSSSMLTFGGLTCPPFIGIDPQIQKAIWPCFFKFDKGHKA